MSETFIIQPDNDVYRRVLHHMSEMDANKEWQVDIKPYKKNKSAQQRNYYHKLLEILEDFNGDTVEDWKDRMCLYNGYYDMKEVAKDVIDKITGEVMVKKGTTYPKRWSTEDLKTKEYSKLIEDAILACGALELSYPQPDEDRGYSR